jgi:hypothetical protein
VEYLSFLAACTRTLIATLTRRILAIHAGTILFIAIHTRIVRTIAIIIVVVKEFIAFGTIAGMQTIANSGKNAIYARVIRIVQRMRAIHTGTVVGMMQRFTIYNKLCIPYLVDMCGYSGRAPYFIERFKIFNLGPNANTSISRRVFPTLDQLSFCPRELPKPLTKSVLLVNWDQNCHLSHLPSSQNNFSKD